MSAIANKLLLILWLLGVACLPAGAQNQVEVYGRVVDDSGNPLDLATVKLLSLPDSVPLGGSWTDADGVFHIAMKETALRFAIEASFAGYGSASKEGNPGDNGTIVLKPSVQGLDEVVVTRRVAPFKLRGEGVTVEVAGSPLADVGNGEQLLNMIPGLAGSGDDWTVFGREGVEVYINGRKVRSQVDVSLLSAADIQNVEVIANPGVKYNADVKGVIRIRTKRKKGEGWSIYATSMNRFSEACDFSDQLNASWRRGNVDVSATLWGSHERYVWDTQSRQTSEPGGPWVFSFDQRSRGQSTKLMGQASVAWNPTPSSSLGLRWRILDTPDKKSRSNYLGNMTRAGSVTDEIESHGMDKTKSRPDNLLNAYYSLTSGAVQWDFNVDWLQNAATTDERVEETDMHGDRTVISGSHVRNRLLAAKADLSAQIGAGSIDGGAEWNLTLRNDNSATTAEGLEGLRLGVRQSSYALYASYTLPTKAGVFNAGLRYEYLHFLYSGYRSDNQLDEKRIYSNLFPSAGWQMQFGNVGVQLAWAMRHQQPSYSALDGAMHYNDRYTYSSGNPWLKPETTNDVSVAAVWSWLQMQFSYQNSRDAIRQWLIPYNDKGCVLNYMVNLPRLQTLSVYASAAPKFGIWSPVVTAGVNRVWVNSGDLESGFAAHPRLEVEWNNILTLPKAWSITATVDYASMGNADIYRHLRNLWGVDLSVTKFFAKKQLSVQLAAYDIFDSHKSVMTGNFGKVETWQSAVSDSRQIVVTLTYRLNARRSRYQGQGAGDAEKERLK